MLINKNPMYLTKEELKVANIVKGIGIGLLITIGVTIYFVFFKIPSEVRTAEKKMQSTYGEKYMDVKYLNKEIIKGDPIKDEDLVTKSVPVELVPEELKVKPAVYKGMVARVTLSQNTMLTSTLVVSMDKVITDDIKTQDYSHVKLLTGLLKDDFVDVRIRRKDGTDDIVLSKKQVIDINGGIIIWNISETERAYFNSATVEAQLTQGELYTTKYPDPQNQKEAIVTYKPNTKILEMIKENEDIVKKAQTELQQRLENKDVKDTKAEDKKTGVTENYQNGNKPKDDVSNKPASITGGKEESSNNGNK
jgi:hypothetical protein